MSLTEQDLAKMLHELKMKNSYYSEVILKNFGKNLSITTKDSKVDIPISNKKSTTRSRNT